MKEHTNDKVLFGMWVYIMSDCVLFAGLFATYAVLHGSTFGGPGPRELFSLPFVLIETLLLLTSSFTIGLAQLFAHEHKKQWALAALGFTLLLGVCFLGMEVSEFRNLVAEGHSWQTSAFLSSFFTLVGTHGLHVLLASIWMLVLIVRITIAGLTPGNIRKLLCLGLFWHFLDIVWIFIFTFVYLFGVLSI